MRTSPESRVLVVDDCEALRFLKVQYLLQAGFQISEAGTGKAALQALEVEHPNLVLLDVNLPDMHGSEVCRAIKERWALPVIWTSSVDVPVELHSMADACSVSLDEQDLIATVRMVLQNSSHSVPQPTGAPPEGGTGIPCPQPAPAEITARSRFFESGLPGGLLDAAVAPIVILNRDRRIVFCNRAALALAGASGPMAASGLPLCEAYQCIHTTQLPRRAGAGEACRTCGGMPGENRGEWHIVRSFHGSDGICDLKVTASAIEGLEGLTMCTLTDYGPEKVRRHIERQFFHDILNIAGGLKGCAALLRKELGDDSNGELAGLIDQSAIELLSEIQWHQKLLHAEAGQLLVQRTPVQSLELIQTAVAEYRSRSDSTGRIIVVDPLSEDVRMETDPAILLCVLGSMLKNALTATRTGGTVMVGCQVTQGGIEFCVEDSHVIPDAAQAQVFRYLASSTDGGRALRNHCIKLMTEQYLGGSVRFESNPLHATHFMACLPLAMDSVRRQVSLSNDATQFACS